MCVYVYRCRLCYNVLLYFAFVVQQRPPNEEVPGEPYIVAPGAEGQGVNVHIYIYIYIT